MKVDIIAIGNSKGIRIPKALLEQCGFSEKAEINVKDQQLVIRPLSKPRSGWEEAFKLQNAKSEKVLDGYIPTIFDETEWQW